MRKQVYIPSRFKGVCSQDGGKAWRCALKVGGKQVQAGLYETEEHAAKACDKVLFLSTGDASGVNLGPLTAEELESLRGVTLTQFIESARAARAKFAKGSSSFRGVSWTKKKGKWSATITNPASRKNEYLGYFHDETEAALAYDKRALELLGAKAKLNFAADETSAPTAQPEGAAAAAAAPGCYDDSEPDESEATPERIQRWIVKGLLILDPLPTDDGSFVYIDETATGDANMSDDDSDGSGDGDDSDASDFSSGDEAVMFDEQYPGEADDPNAQDDPFITCCSPADLALALANDASLARHPDVVKLVAFFTENAVDGDEPAMEAIAKICAAAGIDPAVASQEWTWGVKSDEPPPYRGLNFKAREGQAAFQPPGDPDCVEWKTRPFFDFGDGKGFVRMRNLLEPSGMRFNRAYELIEKRIAIERDWLNSTYLDRALPISVDEKRAHAEPMDPGMRYFRATNISDLFKQMLAIKDYEAIEVNNPGILDDLRADAAVAEAEMSSAYTQYVQDLAQRQSAEASAAAVMLNNAPEPAAPPRVCDDWRAIPQPPQRPYAPFDAQQASMQHVGSLSADALAAMLQEQPAQSVVTMHADGSETWDGPLADELRTRIDVAAAALIAEGDARSAALTGNLEEKAAQLLAQTQELAAKVDASEARCDAYRRQIGDARADEYLMMQQCKEEFSGELWPMFTELRAKSLARLAAEAEARSVAADAAAPASEAAAAAAARDALASARAAQFKDAETDEPITAALPAPLVPGAVGDAFFNDADDEEAVAELERQASAKLGRMDLPATIARVRARIAGADPLVQSCLGAVFTGFGAPGTEEEGAVRTVLTYAARELETAVAEREAAEE